MPRIYVTGVRSNAKVGVSCALGQKTLIIGPNGSGKSAIVNAVELALTGKASDLVGRETVAREVELMSLAPNREGSLFAEVTLSDGSSAFWSAKGSTTKASKAEHKLPVTVSPDTAFPVRSVLAAVLGSPETARKFFLQHCSGTVTREDVLARIEESLHVRYAEAVAACPMTASPVSRLLFALETAAKKARDAKAVVESTRETAEAAAQGLGPAPTTSQLKTAKDAVTAAKAKLEHLIAVQASASSAAATQANLQRMREDATRAEQSAQSAREAFEKAKADFETLKLGLDQFPAQAQLSPLQQGLVLLLRAADDGRWDNCPLCGLTPGAPLFVARRQDAEQKIVTKLRATSARGEAEKRVNDAHAAMLTQHRMAEQNLANAKYLREQVDRMSAGTGSAATVSPADVEAARVTLRTAEDQLAMFERAASAWEVAKRARASASTKESEIADWTKLESACSAAVRELLDTGVAGFVLGVQARLPKTDKFQLRLRDGNREVCQFGLLRDGVLHTALSGAEWARVVAAIAVVFAPADGPSVIALPDRSYDPNTLLSVMRELAACDSQVIITTTTRPDSVPDGWQVIDTRENEHQRGAVLGAETSASPPATPASIAREERIDAVVTNLSFDEKSPIGTAWVLPDGATGLFRGTAGKWLLFEVGDDVRQIPRAGSVSSPVASPAVPVLAAPPEEQKMKNPRKPRKPRAKKTDAPAATPALVPAPMAVLGSPEATSVQTITQLRGGIRLIDE